MALKKKFITDKLKFVTDDLVNPTKQRHKKIVEWAKEYGKGFFVDSFHDYSEQKDGSLPVHKVLKFCREKDFDVASLSQENKEIGLVIRRLLKEYDCKNQYILVIDIDRIIKITKIIPFDNSILYQDSIYSILPKYPIRNLYGAFYGTDSRN